MTEPNPTNENPGESGPAGPRVPVVRSLLGGGLMGLANLVPGISGGTMLVASGVYHPFIEAVSDVTRLRLRARSLVLLALVVAGAGVAVVGLAGVISAALAEARWAMYALFIGLTLGGVPLLWSLADVRSTARWIGTGVGFVAMAALVFAQSRNTASAGTNAGPVMLFVGGVSGAAAMILPGVSGAFLLLVLGLYETIIGAVKDFARAGADLDTAGLIAAGRTLLPVGLGVVVGAAVVSAGVRWMLRRFKAFTIGLLLGLLIASPLGLYPFRDAAPPAVGDVINGVAVTEANLAELTEDPKDWPERVFTPTAAQIAAALGLVGVGFVATLLIARLDRGDRPSDDDAPDA